ncbi:MAG: DUF5106 domain-containing protein [Bacteroidales bacterium]|nr:DUF5106 domain-containing protein [Bacteroidales bacterium]
MKKILLLICVFGFLTNSFAKGYKIQASVDGLKDTFLLLGYYFGDKKYVVDTAQLNSQGIGVFEGDSLLNGGIYLVLTPSYRYFELILDKDQEFGFETDTSNLFKKITFKGSDDNIVFNKYQLFTAEMQKNKAPLIKNYRDNLKIKDSVGISDKDKKKAEEEIKKVKSQIDELDKQIKAYEDSLLGKYPENLLSSVLKIMREIEIPDYPRNEKGEITDSLFKYRYLTTHYFDNFNFGDRRLLRTPVFQPKIDDYLDNQIIQIPDSIIVEVDKIITLAKADAEIYKFLVHHLFMKYQNPKIMGLDNIFVHIAEKYYLSGEAYWAKSDTAFMNKVKDRYDKMRYNQVGKPSVDMTTFNLGYFWQKLHSINAEYIVLYFYEPSCGHCKKTIPKWHELYVENKLKEKGVESVLFYTQADTVEWRAFINQHKLTDCINVFDPYQNTNFRTFYDIYSTPVSYVLDKKKNIIAKRIPPETIIDLLNRRLEAVKPE